MSDLVFSHTQARLILNLGAMTWQCYIENDIIKRGFIMHLKCTCIFELYGKFK